MTECTCGPNGHDFGRGLMALFWWAPALAIVIAGVWGGWFALTLVWPLAFGVMGVGCVLNARRCRRVHCYFTGPFFLLVAALTLLHGLRLLPLGADGWANLGWGALIGAMILCFVPERIWGRYFAARRGVSRDVDSGCGRPL